MKKMINTSTLVGPLYQHNLEMKVTGPTSKKPGTSYIRGSIDIATDDECKNTVTVKFSYVSPTTKNGSPNETYNLLKDIIDGKVKTVIADGIENATIIKANSSVGLNEFFTDKGGDLDFVSTKINDGGFLFKLSRLDEKEIRNSFVCDMVITNVRKIEATENTPEKVSLKGAIFDFRGSLLPVEFSVTSESGMNYFEGLEASPQTPVFTKVEGKQISETTESTKVEESAFGDDIVRTVKRTRKDYVVTFAAKFPYEWDDEATLTAAELTKAMKDRELYLAELKQRYTDNKNKPAAAPIAAAGGFAF